jgi:signal transduction histidine kinase
MSATEPLVEGSLHRDEVSGSTDQWRSGPLGRRVTGILQRHPGARESLVVAQQLAWAVAIYAVAALAWQKLGGGTGRPGVVTVIVATAVVAVVLSRSRRAFERLVNWLAFGERADGYEIAAGFLEHLATSLDLDDVLPRLAETAARTVGSPSGEVKVWLADGNSWKQTWPLDAPTDDPATVVQVRHSGDPVGEMSVSVPAEDLSPADRRLLDELAGPAGLALSTVRLTHALRQQAIEIEQTAEQITASRERIVDARRSEQARIRDQLDARVQPDLDAARDLLGRRVPPDAASVELAAGCVERSIQELRLLARELYPARLGETGLDGAVWSWAEQTGRPVDVMAAGDVRGLDDEVAAALYFCTVTALGQSGGRASVRVTRHTADVLVEIRLGAAPSHHVLQALADRAEAFEGNVRCQQDGATGGVRVSVRFPVGTERGQ